MYNQGVIRLRSGLFPLLILGMLFCLAACSVPLGAGGSGPALSDATPGELLARRLVPLTATATPRPTATKTSTPDPAAAEPVGIGGQELAALPLEAPLEEPAVQPAFQICSPLYNILREDLPRLISDGYNPPPRSRADDRHHGVDFSYYHWKGGGPIAGTGIQSALAGVVAMALEGTFPYGDVVIVETPRQDLPADLQQALNIPEGQSLYLLYAHMQEDTLQVQLGDTVTACQILGAVGRSGNTDANHLHLETRLGPPGTTFSGMSAFTDIASEDEKRNYRTWRVSGKYQHFDPLRLLLYGLEDVYIPPRLATPEKVED